MENNMRGGILMVSKRVARADNPRVDGYDPTTPKSPIIYLYANNPYGWAMIQALPVGGFEWDEDCQSLERIIAQYLADSQERSILEVDLEYPNEVRKVRNMYPLTLESMVIQKSGCQSIRKTS